MSSDDCFTSITLLVTVVAKSDLARCPRWSSAIGRKGQTVGHHLLGFHGLRGRHLCCYQVLVKMLQLAMERLEKNRYMTPDEKYRNLRALPHILWWVQQNPHGFHFGWDVDYAYVCVLFCVVILHIHV